MAEERRLAYVGITAPGAAVSVPGHRALGVRWPSTNPPVRFLDEFPTELLDWRRPRRSARAGGHGRLRAARPPGLRLRRPGMRGGSDRGSWRPARPPDGTTLSLSW